MHRWREATMLSSRMRVRSRLERRKGLADLDDVGREHMPDLGAEVRRVVRYAGWNQKAITGVQRERRCVADLHSHGAAHDVAHLFPWVVMPAGRHPNRDLGQDLHDLPPGDRGSDALHLGSLQRLGELVAL